MGWAKYWEDNISICNDRLNSKNPSIDSMRALRQDDYMIAREQVIAIEPKRGNQVNHRVEKLQFPQKRYGLELRFPVSPERSLVRKLQLNGWWWSNNAGSWCNYDSEANRRYARDSLCKWNPKLIITRAS